MVMDHINEDAVVFDIGSHIGTYSIPIAQKLKKGKGRLYSFEANKATYDFLEKNIHINKLDHIIKPALGIVSGRGSQYHANQIDQNTGSTYYIQDDVSGRVNPTIDLNDFIIDEAISHIDFVKVDVEGMEYIVLQDIQHILETQRPTLYIEISTEQLSRYGNSPDDIEALLRPLNYNFFMNTYKRNSNEDLYIKSEIEHLNILPFFDLLAIPK